MLKRARVEGSGSRSNLAAEMVRMAAAVLTVVGVMTGGSGVAPEGVAASSPPPAAAQPPAADGGFTAAQADAGWTVYARQCGECHGPQLDGAEAPPLREGQA